MSQTAVQEICNNFNNTFGLMRESIQNSMVRDSVWNQADGRPGSFRHEPIKVP
jgi:hypothetical protein